MYEVDDELSIVEGVEVRPKRSGFYTSTPAKSPRCIDLFDFDTDSSCCGTPPKRPVRINLVDSFSEDTKSEWSSPVKPVRIDLDDSTSTDNWNECFSPMKSSRNVTCIDLNDSTSRESQCSSEWKDEMSKNHQEIHSFTPTDEESFTSIQHSNDQGSRAASPVDCVEECNDNSDEDCMDSTEMEQEIDKSQDLHLPMSIVGNKKIFLDISLSESNTSAVTEWLSKLGATTCAFLNKKIDIIITNREMQEMKSLPVSDGKNLRRSTAMLELAQKFKNSGSSSIWSVAFKWSIKVLKYSDVLSLMKKFPINNNKVNQVGKKTIKKNPIHVRTLKPPFIKVEDQSRRYKPEFAEFKSFPYLDFDNTGTNSPFDKWWKENR